MRSKPPFWQTSKGLKPLWNQENLSISTVQSEPPAGGSNQATMFFIFPRPNLPNIQFTFLLNPPFNLFWNKQGPETPLKPEKPLC